MLFAPWHIEAKAIGNLRIALITSLVEAVEAFDIALKSRLSSYDIAYTLISKKLGCILMTADRELK